MRAQMSSEFIFVYSALLFIFVVVFVIYFGGSLNLHQAQDSAAALHDAQSIAAAINYVYLAGDGASLNFTPTGIRNEENITISSFAVTSELPHASASAPLLDARVSFTSLERGGVRITNNQGEINITN